ncbi:MAG: hypothetical protein ACK5LC_01235 [Coprobacillaceae bacterium]
MISKIKYPLNLQLFADGDPVGGNQDPIPPAVPTPPTPPTPQIDYDELGNAVAKGVSQKENAILKDYFKRQGLSEEEAQQAMATFKTTKAEEATNKEKELQKIIDENKCLKEQALNSDIATCALGQGIPNEKAPFVLKLIDREGLTKEDGTTDAEKLKTAIEELLKVFPELKPNAQNPNGFQQIGAPGNDQNNPNAKIALASAFGNKN